MTTPIPCPPSLPFLGHVTSIEKEVPLRSFALLARQYGEIYELHQFSRTLIVVSSYELLNEVSDDKRFFKDIGGSLEQVRNGVGDGIFTARPDEENWGIAHRLLMPAFGTTAIRGMFDDMMDIASQLIMKWERFGPGAVINPAEDFTRLTFDTIALCSMSHRLNSFYRETNHPFVQAMVDFLIESGHRAFRPSIVTSVMGYNTKYEQDIKIMADLANEIIADRKANPVDRNDLLNKMLLGKDPKTGKGLSDEAVRYNLLTFLIAGHETTSSTLSFTLYYLLKNPEAARKLREELDEVLGDQPPQLGDMNKLPYLTACLRESLRLNPPAPMRTVDSSEDTTIGGGKYAIKKGQTVVINSPLAMRDHKVWGDDAEEFRPERMLDGKFEALPPNAWQPFGFGMRACIGRAFAWQEMMLVMAYVFQRFDLVMDDPSYELKIKQTLTIKPKDLHIRAIPRTAAVPLAMPSSSLHRARRGTEPKQPTRAAVPGTGVEPRQWLYVLYGSNTGTSETFAQRVASDAAAHGFCTKMGTLDSFCEKLPSDGPVVIITASFEGEPADNAAHFVEWIRNLKGKELANVNYAVFGCGNHDWVLTYQRIPTLIDDTLEERGGRRLVPRGAGDASSPEFFEVFDEWEAKLWETLSKEYSATATPPSAAGGFAGLEIKVVDAGTFRASVLRQPDAALGTVIENRLLTAPSAPPKRHIEFELPEGMAARAGDYLAILPSNPPRDVHRAIARFGLSAEQEVLLSSAGPTPLPVDRPISVSALLSGYVELSQPATTRDLRILMTAEKAPAEALQELLTTYGEKVLVRRLSVLDILEDYPEIKLPFETYLQMLPSMRVRQYSISSSPLWDAQRVSLTVSVVDKPSIAGRKESFLGVASTFLAGLRPGDKVQIAVRASSAAFHPPSDPTVPMVMFAAGSGLAPMRGFLQERAMQKKAGREVARSLLFFGCRTPKEDYLYADSDLKEWTELGIVDVRPAFSRLTEESSGCKYVQDRAWHDRAEIDAAYKANGKVGSR
ncbi:cytochrome P450 [Laetiporus sulphureus 93-53]|uniref:Cytochrome P450 n=1 Tax=Laetiporus sulphureus 93-53 TaxID=1314785 RepID=A0A165DAC1_9APHY|nr:cytochrome P450 [Laetiporus sulphureus 93-53]KZT04430.1 cytochrome P450 [Laetiporus sulphureus 93-53]